MKDIIAIDKQLFLFLNNLGSEQFDFIWLLITKQLHWTPFFIVVFYFIQKKTGWKNFGIIILFIALLITFTDQFTNLVKTFFERTRPCNVPEFQGIMRIVKDSETFSFFSGHAANSMATTTFVFLILRNFYKNVAFLYFFPLVFAYSRIYLGLHFPSDIITGYFFGMIFGFLCFLIYKKYNHQVFYGLQNPTNG